MDRRGFPTKDAEAFSSFVQGRALFQSYLGTGLGEELQEARERFATAAARDSEFHIAKLYLAATQTELREPDAAIPNLEELVEKNHYVPEARVQLAYAHVKRYRDVDYVAAENELHKALEAARTGNREDLVEFIESYRIFLLAVRGGRGKEDIGRRRQYLEDAVAAGNRLLSHLTRKEKTSGEYLAVQFETRNAIGIALLWLGELFSSDPDAPSRWTESERYLRSALAVKPNSVRALQNMGLLRMLQGDRSQQQEIDSRESYEEAKQFVRRSLALNSFDQYPHFQMALLSARTQDWLAARDFVDSGKRQKGAISREKWETLEKAIEDRNRLKILTFR